MKISRLRISHFRNIEETSFEPNGNLNFLIGQNGQGKTSILEAIHYLSHLSSFRKGKTEEVIQWDQSISEVSCTIRPQGLEADLKIVLENGTKSSKTAFINGKKYKSSTQYISQRYGNYRLGFHTIVFNPSDHELIKGQPSLRRTYLDQVLFAEDISYLKTFKKFQRILDQRNKLLKEALNRVGDKKAMLSILPEFTEQLAAHSAQITFERLKWLRRLSEKIEETVKKIAPDQPAIRPEFFSSWVSPEYTSLKYLAGQEELPSLELLEQLFWKKVSGLRDAEIAMGMTLAGPQRDDWGFYLGSQLLKGHGSQGEVRTALLGLKLCEIELFRSKTGHQPVLLLDDFSSELDRQRREYLLNYLLECDLQVFVTTTESSVPIGQYFWVKKGKILSSLDDTFKHNSN